MRKILVLLICLSLTGCKFYDEYEMPKDVYIKLNNKSIDVYDEKKLKDIIKDTNVKITNKNKVLPTNKIGKQKITINYTYKKRTYKFETSYEVKDEVKPIFLSASSTRYTKVSEDINLCDNIVYADNYDKKIVCQIDGEYDINTIGKYNLKYLIKDSSNNENSEEFVLNVVNEEPDNKYEEYESEKHYFSDIISKYKTDDNEVGIDVSAWQGDIDFNKVREAGCDFVIIRMGYNYKNKLNLDSYYESNIKKANESGLKVGVYLYTMAKTKKEAKEQAKFVIKNLKNYKIDFPVAYDFEDWSNFKDYNLSLHDLYELFKTFNDELNKSNYKAMIYGSKYYLETAWMNLNKHDVWLAHYTDETNYEGDYNFWQMSNTGRINGIDGDVDIDIKK